MKRLVLGIVVIGCALVTPTVGYASWSTPVQVASSQVWQFGPGPPQLATDAQGDGVVVWHREEVSSDTMSGIEASTQHRGEAWSAPVSLSHPRNAYAFSPAVAMHSQGDVVATWEQSSRGHVVEAARESQAGSWEKPVRVSRPSERGREPDVAVSGRGEPSIVFLSGVLGTARVKLSVGRRSHGWGSPHTVGGNSLNIREPRMAVDTSGEAIVAWIAASENNNWVQAVMLDSRGQPEGPVQTLSSRRGHSAELRLVANEKGDAVLVWRQAGVKHRPIEAATRAAAARFTRAVTVSGGDDVEPTAAINQDGDAAILFTRILGTQPEPGGGLPPGIPPLAVQTSAVEVASRQGHGHWTQPAPVAPAAGGSTFTPQIASSTAGNHMMAVWANSPFRGTTSVLRPGKIEASVSTGTGSWQAPVAISAGESGWPSIAVSSKGEATAVWVTSHESDKSESLEVAEYKTAP